MDGIVDNAKGIVSIVRDGLITLVLLLLLLVPKSVNSRLIDAGFVSGNIAGFQWQATVKQVKQNKEALGDAANTINALQEQLGKTQAALQTSEQARQKLADQVATAAPGSPVANAATAAPPVPTTQIVQQNNQLVNRSQIYAERLREQVRANEQLLATVPAH